MASELLAAMAASRGMPLSPKPVETISLNEKETISHEEGETLSDFSSDVEVSEDSDEFEQEGVDEVSLNDPASQVKKEPTYEMLDVRIGDKTSKIKVNMQDQEQLKKAIVASVQAKHVLAAQKQKLEASQSRAAELEDYQASFDAVKTAWSSKGIEGLVDLMGGKEGSYKEFMNKQIARELLKRDASPLELERLDLEERLEALQKSVKNSEVQATQREANAKALAEKAEHTRIESAIAPAFDKHRFAGELGDPVLEARMDKAIWSSALDELKEFAALNGQHAVTNQVTNRIFSDIAKSIKGAFQVQSNKEASKSAEQRKVDAATKVATTALAGQRSTGSGQELQKQYNQHMKAGNLSKALEVMRAIRGG